MPCCEVNAVCLSDHAKNSENCRPCVKENWRNTALDKSNDKFCIRNVFGKSNCIDQECLDINHHQHKYSKNIKEDDNLYCVTHSCPLDKVMGCTDCMKKYKEDCACNTDIIKEEDIRNTQEAINCQVVHSGELVSENIHRSCCAKKPSWTEPRICQCGPCDPYDYLKYSGCEGVAPLLSEAQKEKPKKTVRFSDEVVEYEDRDKVFPDPDPENVDYLCCCCKENASLGKEQCVAKPVLVYEFPEPKLEDTSVTQRDFCNKKIPPREVPLWHPNRKDRWRHLDVPSLSETTYQSDFKPPVLVQAERKPVYLDLQRQKLDPCEQLPLKLPEKHCTWKRTSEGENNTCYVPCEAFEKDRQRGYLHECDVTHLAPQCQCHGDGHTCQILPSTGEKFANCEKVNTAESRYWWKRTGTAPSKEEFEKFFNLPPDLMEPVCPPYTTSYKIDFKNPHRLQDDRPHLKNCISCETCTRPQGEEQFNLLCTKATQ